MSTPHHQYSGLIPNLPEGVTIVNVRIGRSDEYELYGNTIIRATRAASAQVIVKPSAGWRFVPNLEIPGQFKAEKLPVTPISAVQTTPLIEAPKESK